MQSLWCWRIVNQFYFQGMRLMKFVSGKFDHGRIGAKQSIRAHCIKLIIEAQIVILFSYGLLE